MSSIILLLAGFLLVFPPLGTIIAFLIFIFSIGINIQVFVTNLSYETDVLQYSTLFGNLVIQIADIEKIENIKYFGIDASSPFTIRKVVLKMDNGEIIDLPTLVFPWYTVLDLVYTINTKHLDREEV